MVKKIIGEANMKKRILTILAILAFVLNASCSSLFYDCETATDNMWDVCAEPADYPYESLYKGIIQSTCENGDGTNPAWTEDQIECVTEAGSCPDANICVE